MYHSFLFFLFFFFKQKTAYEMRISDWSSDVCSSDLAALERALGRVADHPVHTTAAGRTDSGVHALQQIVHFDTDAQRSDYGWLLGANSNLAADISLRWVQVVPLEFHARYGAIRSEGAHV